MIQMLCQLTQENMSFKLKPFQLTFQLALQLTRSETCVCLFDFDTLDIFFP